MRVRTTSFKLAPAWMSAASIFLIVCTVCAWASPTPTILPSGPVAVVPDTEIVLPIRTAREYPTIGSHGAPLEIFCRLKSVSLCSVRCVAIRQHAKLEELWHSPEAPLARRSARDVGMKCNNNLEAIGQTPLIRLNRINQGLQPQMYVKAEFTNPGGSVKERIGITMIDEAE